MFDDTDRSDDAMAVCEACPVRRQCRRWALANVVHGVAGGMTPDDRAAWRKEAGVPEPTIRVDDFLFAEVVSADTAWGRGRSAAILDAVATWTASGVSARDIGNRLGITQRTVSRLRARCSEHVGPA